MTGAVEPAQASTPGLARRMACFLYEGVLLFGVVWITGMVYGIVTQQRHALAGSDGLKLALFLVLCAYFTFFWSRTGQTLAMLTWHIRVVRKNGEPVRPLRALARYLLSWLWFLPALALVHFWGLHSAWAIVGALTSGVLAYAALTRLHPDRQYWHDAACQTRLVTWHPPHRKPKPAS